MSKDYDQAIYYAKKAKLWPKNLGVGKHYDVDERLDDYLLALSYEKKGASETAKYYYEAIMAHKTPEYLNESSKLYLQLVVLEKFKKESKIQGVLQKVSNNAGNNQYMEWAIARYKNTDHEALKDALLNSIEQVHAYDTKFIDDEFRLVTSVVEALTKIK